MYLHSFLLCGTVTAVVFIHDESVKVVFTQTKAVPVTHCWQPDDPWPEVISPAARLLRHVCSQHTHPRICINQTSPSLLSGSPFLTLSLFLCMYLYVSVCISVCFFFSMTLSVFLWLCYMVVLVFLQKANKIFLNSTLTVQRCVTFEQSKVSCY